MRCLVLVVLPSAGRLYSGSTVIELPSCFPGCSRTRSRRSTVSSRELGVFEKSLSSGACPKCPVVGFVKPI